MTRTLCNVPTLARVALATLACVGFLGASALPALAAPAHAKKYVAKQKIHRDAGTGELRLPTAEETAALVANLEGLTNRSTEGLSQRPGLDGAQVLELKGRFMGVVLAKPREDGSFETRCVWTFEQAADFLGLVPEGEAGSGSDNAR